MAQSLKLIVLQPKKEYITGELIDIGLSIKNVINSTIMPNLNESVKIRVFSEDGTEFPQRGYSVDFISPSASQLEPGKYNVKIKFHLPDMADDSLSLDFNVTSPKGEELTTYESLINTLFLLETNQYNDSRFVTELRNLADAHPKLFICQLY